VTPAPPFPLTSALGPAATAELDRLEAAYEERHGHAALGDAVRRSLVDPAPGAASFATASAGGAGTEPADGSVDGPAHGRPGPGAGPWAGFVHVAPAENDAPGTWEAGLLIAPGDSGHETDHDAVATALLRAAADHAGERGADRIVLWITAAHDADDRAAAAAGFTGRGALVQLRVPVPPADTPTWPPGTTVRPYRPGADDPAWLEVNNRAFAGHPEQGSWTPATLERRRREPWFDPDDLLLAEDAAGLAGFCWTKVHAATAHDPPLGEIYVIGVDPSRQGRGLGRALVLAGLHHLAGRGPRVGMLYVDAANTAATTLYRSLGFQGHRTDRAYEWTRPEAPRGGSPR